MVLVSFFVMLTTQERRVSCDSPMGGGQPEEGGEEEKEWAILKEWVICRYGSLVCLYMYISPLAAYYSQ